MSCWLAGGKYDDLFLKKREYKGEKVEKRGESENFHRTWGKKYDFWKKNGMRQKYHIFWKYTPLID